MLLRQEQRHFITQRIDPKIILANSILQLNTMELMQSIENELLENPALEVVEEANIEAACPPNCLCPKCVVNHQEEGRPEALSLRDLEFEYEGHAVPDLYPSDEEYDLLGNLEAEMTLQDYLCSQLRAAASADDYPIGEYLISNLDERGWLREDPSLIALELGTDVSEVKRVLAILQSLDPPGVGAQTLQECLLLQIRYLNEERHRDSDTSILKRAEILIRDHFENFWKRRYPRLARVLKCNEEEVKEVSEFVSQHLNPFPASQFRPPHDYSPSNTRAVIRPDVIIRRGEFGYEIEVGGAEAYILSVNPHYRNAYMQLKADRSSLSESDRKHFTEYVERAERFITNIQLRRQTLRQITRCIVECQSGFLETGSAQFLRPLTRTRVARILNIHESTVSRATANKFAQLPNQEVVPFELFFDSTLAIKNAIGAIIKKEDAANPLSDQQIVEMLRDQGYEVARRTIVKYREQEKILSSTRRRR